MTFMDSGRKGKGRTDQEAAGGRDPKEGRITEAERGCRKTKGRGKRETKTAAGTGEAVASAANGSISGLFKK